MSSNLENITCIPVFKVYDYRIWRSIKEHIFLIFTVFTCHIALFGFYSCKTFPASSSSVPLSSRRTDGYGYTSATSWPSLQVSSRYWPPSTVLCWLYLLYWLYLQYWLYWQYTFLAADIVSTKFEAVWDVQALVSINPRDRKLYAKIVRYWLYIHEDSQVLASYTLRQSGIDLIHVKTVRYWLHKRLPPESHYDLKMPSERSLLLLSRNGVITPIRTPNPSWSPSSLPFPLSCFLHWLQTSITQSFIKLESFLIPFLITRGHDESAHTFRSSHWFLEVPQKGVLKKWFLVFLEQNVSSTFCNQTSSTCHTDTTQSTQWIMEWYRGFFLKIWQYFHPLTGLRKMT